MGRKGREVVHMDVVCGRGGVLLATELGPMMPFVGGWVRIKRKDQVWTTTTCLGDPSCSSPLLSLDAVLSAALVLPSQLRWRSRPSHIGHHNSPRLNGRMAPHVRLLSLPPHHDQHRRARPERLPLPDHPLFRQVVSASSSHTATYAASVFVANHSRGPHHQQARATHLPPPTATVAGIPIPIYSISESPSSTTTPAASEPPPQPSGGASASPPPAPARSTLFSVVLGAIANITTLTLIAPLERIKLLLQTQHASPQIAPHELFRGVWDALRRVPQEQGFYSLWRGNSANIARFFPNMAFNLLLKVNSPPPDPSYLSFNFYV